MPESLSNAVMDGDNHPVYVPDTLPQRAYEPNSHNSVPAGLFQTINIEDVFFMDYPVNNFAVNREFMYTVDAKNGTATISCYPKDEETYFTDLDFTVSYYKGAPEYGTQEFSIAGFEAVRVFYRDPNSDSSCESVIFIDFGGKIREYYGVMITCSSNFDMESTWNEQVTGVLETMRLAPDKK
jgi:hypothetical protein